ncbi:hypothetical protein [Rothia sp. ZJ1223]|uniref:hypothetical protein n=1 Tax=Rothia sp. ZJ1223 TaxID=2811098 RepID=UPI0019568281|nr:hypothetical protein [Rothia sp. ZJ1223]MBM7051992.1 hypothetical protein [Rothia sp. ZJ1223]
MAPLASALTKPADAEYGDSASDGDSEESEETAKTSRDLIAEKKAERAHMVKNQTQTTSASE